MNQKQLIIMLSVLVTVIIALILWIILLNRPAAEAPAINAPVTVNTETTTLPTGQPNPPATIIQPPVTTSIDQITDQAIEEHFTWVRNLFVNENDASRRLASYFERTGLDQEIILYQCNLASETHCLADLREALQVCKLSGEEYTHLPLAFDRSTKRCYQTYTEIINYLNDELATVLKNRQQLR